MKPRSPKDKRSWARAKAYGKQPKKFILLLSRDQCLALIPLFGRVSRKEAEKVGEVLWQIATRREEPEIVQIVQSLRALQAKALPAKKAL